MTRGADCLGAYQSEQRIDFSVWHVQCPCCLCCNVRWDVGQFSWEVFSRTILLTDLNTLSSQSTWYSPLRQWRRLCFPKGVSLNKMMERLYHHATGKPVNIYHITNRATKTDQASLDKVERLIGELVHPCFPRDGISFKSCSRKPCGDMFHFIRKFVRPGQWICAILTLTNRQDVYQPNATTSGNVTTKQCHRFLGKRDELVFSRLNLIAINCT